MSAEVWGIIGVLLALLGLGIPLGYTLRSLMKEALDVLKSVKDLLNSVQTTVNKVYSTVDKMSAFIDRNERQHAELRTFVESNFNRVVDKVDNEADRIVDNLRK